MLHTPRSRFVPGRRLVTALTYTSALATALAWQTCGSAEESWPEFRGPTAQGLSMATGLPQKWSPTQGTAWQADVAGRGWSSPIVAEGKIFLTTAVDKGAAKGATALRVLALDATTGKGLWDTEVFAVEDGGALRMHQKNSQASPTPIYENGRIYAHFGHHGTACVGSDGKVIWQSQENPYIPVHGTGGSPVVMGSLLIFNADAKDNPSIIALDKSTGRTKWRKARESGASRKFSFCTPLVIEVAGQTQIVSAGSGVVYGMKPEDGSIVWSATYDQGYSVVPRPVFAHGMVFLSSGYDKPVGLAVRVDGTGDVTSSHVAWTLDKNVPRNSSMVVVGDELYMVDDGGIMTCVDARSGKVHWSERVLGPCSSSLLFGDGHIYATDERGTTAVVQPGTRLKVIATNELREKTLASMAVVGSDLLFRTESKLYRLRRM